MLKQIQKYEEVSPLIRKYFKPRVQTNHFMSEEEYKNCINDNSLYYYEWDRGIVFLKRRKYNYKLTYMINDYDKINLEKVFSDLDMPVVIEYVKRSQHPNGDDIVSFFESQKFKIILKRFRMQLDKKVFENYQSDLVNIKKCSLTDMDSVNQLINMYFNIHTGCIPNEEELKQYFEKGYVFGAFLNNKELIGLLHFSENKGAFEIRHLVVDESHRNKNVAGLLIKEYHDKIVSNRANLWVTDTNNIAQNFYKKHGYLFDRMGI